MNWKAWTVGILGLWLALAGFLALGQSGNLWDDVIVGTVVAVVGFMMIGETPWQGWLSGLLGLWVIIAAFIPTLLAGSGLVWNNLLAGFLIAAAGFAALGAGAQEGKSSAKMHESAHSDCH
ncbi:MAG: hypothetical protein BMS9Abin29_2569 [Gemmatimonadota bacterium]|nr:MAG: hypothetical protein BMS9Abin29_2569 [Gemmatimonadota bacterium]